MKTGHNSEHIADKLFVLLDALYTFVKTQHPSVIGRLSNTLNAQILYMLGEISIEDVKLFDDSVFTVMASELEALHETCIITDCPICHAVATYNMITETR